ncbi:pro-resilin-like isoform X2 [Diorhabda sublineata]|nr:pro-resilin-like isoform X2 [Diorhabda sublineata]
MAVFSIARSEPPSTSYGTPLGSPITNYRGSGSNFGGAAPLYSGQGDYNINNNAYNGGNDHQHGYDHGEPKSYEYGYQVRDEYTGTNYNKQETSDGNQVRGEYRVALPDGRTQIVTYWADWQSGFHADVKYEGEAQFPDQYNKGGYQGVSNQYGTPSYNGYNNGNDASAINNLAGGGNYNYDSYSNGYSSKPPSNSYGTP